MHSTKGLLWLAHSEATLRTEKARAALNTACGADTEFVGPAEIALLCPQLDLEGGGKFPVLGASYHPRGRRRATTGWSGATPRPRWPAASTCTRASASPGCCATARA